MTTETPILNDHNKAEYPPMHKGEENHELRMRKGKTYRYDDEFKKKARAHQFAYRENVLNDFYDEKNPQVILSPYAAKQGLIFCETYRELIKSKVKSFKFSALFSNMLRSEHIPYNIFTPMEEDMSATTALFNEIIGGGISKINRIRIEFAGDADKSEYLNDGTSFDAFIEYVSIDGSIGGIGIEVKYTENGYRIGDKEKKDIEDTDGLYNQNTKKSQWYIPTLDIVSFIRANHLRQIWRNHILGYSMLAKGDIQHFHHIHLYPQGNKHFHGHAIPEYKQLLSEEGLKNFIDLTYESLFNLIEKHFKQKKQKEWLEYLKKRYIVEI